MERDLIPKPPYYCIHLCLLKRFLTRKSRTLSFLFGDEAIEQRPVLLCKMLICWSLIYVPPWASEGLGILPRLKQLTKSDNVLVSYILYHCFFLSFFRFLPRSSAPEANCFWASGEWEGFGPGLVLHLPGYPGRAGWVHAWWSWCGSGWVPVLPHWWTPHRHREDGDIHRAAYRWHPPLGCKSRPPAVSRYHRDGREWPWFLLCWCAVLPSISAQLCGRILNWVCRIWGDSCWGELLFWGH